MSEATRDPADSAVQRELEPVVLARLAAELGGLRLERNRALAVSEGRTVRPDGWITRPDAQRLAVEVSIFLGAPKSA